MKPGSVMADLEHNKVYGDINHCTKEDLAESALELLAIAPKGTRAIGKAYDNDCYIYGIKGLTKLSIEKPSPAVPAITVNQEVHFRYMGIRYEPYGYEKQFATIK